MVAPLLPEVVCATLCLRIKLGARCIKPARQERESLVMCMWGGRIIRMRLIGIGLVDFMQANHTLADNIGRHGVPHALRMLLGCYRAGACHNCHLTCQSHDMGNTLQCITRCLIELQDDIDSHSLHPAHLDQSQPCALQCIAWLSHALQRHHHPAVRPAGQGPCSHSAHGHARSTSTSMQLLHAECIGSGRGCCTEKAAWVLDKQGCCHMEFRCW